MGSGIIFNNGSTGGGGTTINPTNNFIPVRSNATTFVDSCLWQVNVDALRTVFGGSPNGLNIDNSNKTYLLGNFTGGNETYISVEDINQRIISTISSSPYGFYIDGANQYAYFGDPNNFLQVVTTAKYLNLIANNTAYLEIDGINSVGSFGYIGCAFRYDANNFKTSVGDYNGNMNNTFILNDDTNKEIVLYTNSGLIQLDYNDIVFNGPTQLGNSGDPNTFLNVTVNGTKYVIQLFNP